MSYHLDLNTNKEKEIMDWVYRKDRPYEIICTTHNNKAFVRDERQSINTYHFTTRQVCILYKTTF